MFIAALSTVARDWEGNVRILQEGTGWTHYSALTGCPRSSEREHALAPQSRSAGIATRCFSEPGNRRGYAQGSFVFLNQHWSDNKNMSM